jgi:glycerol-3-phosphate cytidylyltransferase
MERKSIIGYTQGTFDMFHIGHLNLLRNAKAHCDKLIVGVNSDSLVEQYKHKTPIINQDERLAIIRAIKYVDEAILVDTLDKLQVHAQCSFDSIFIGDDWKGNPRWVKTEADMKGIGVDVRYLRHTAGISSSLLREKCNYDKNIKTR